MNFELYVFKNGGSNSYPHDDNRVLFEGIMPNNDLGNQLIIRRKGKLIYYIYHLTVVGEGTEGVCLVFNGVLHTKTDYIFRLCNDAVNSLRGGNIYEKSLSDSANQQEVSQELKNAHDHINRFLQKRMDNNFTQLTPSFSFGTGVVRLPITERPSKINEAINNHENVVVFNNAAAPSEVAAYSENFRKKSDFKKMLIYGMGGIALIAVGLLYLLPEKDVQESSDTFKDIGGIHASPTEREVLISKPADISTDEGVPSSALMSLLLAKDTLRERYEELFRTHVLSANNSNQSICLLPAISNCDEYQRAFNASKEGVLSDMSLSIQETIDSLNFTLDLTVSLINDEYPEIQVFAKHIE